MAANYTGPGTATDPTDLLKNQILPWLVAQGWTTDKSQADGAGWRVHIHKGAQYVHFRSVVNETSGIWGGGQYGGASICYGIAMYASTGYNGALAWNLQTGGPIGNGGSNTVGVGMTLPVGAVTSTHFFDDGADNIMIVVERSSGIFTHLGWGNAAGIGTAVTPFFLGSNSGYYAFCYNSGEGFTTSSLCPGSTADAFAGVDLFIKKDIDAFTGKWIGCSTVTGAAQGHTGKKGSTSVAGGATAPPASIPTFAGLSARSVSSYNGQPALLPLTVYVERDAGGYSQVCVLPSVWRCAAVAAGFAAKSVYAVGAKNYMLFPNFAVLKGS